MNMTLRELLLLKPSDFKGEVIPIDEILQWFSLLDAYWLHSGDPKDSHAELTSGYCSNGFFDCLRVLKYINLSDILAEQHAKKIRNMIGQQHIEWLIGSPTAGITYAHDLARALGVPINMCVEKDKSDPTGKRMVWNRMLIPEEAPTFQTEELTTTAKTMNEVERAVREGNKDGDIIVPVDFINYVGILVHRPPKLPVPYYGKRQAIALIEKEIWAVPPEECPLCKHGSKPLRPKTNWKKLTGKA